MTAMQAQTELCNPQTLRTRAEFCEWGTALAARLGVPYPVRDSALRDDCWGLVGQGVGINLNLAEIEAAHAADPHAHFRFISDSVGVLLHEIAHPLSVAIMPIEAPALSKTDADAAITKWAAASEPPDCPPWDDGHSARFIRTALHVQHRVETMLGFGILPDTIVDCEQYQLSSIYHYCNALGTEREKLAGEPFTVIRQTQPPEAFVTHWQADVDRWFSALASPSRFQIAAREAALSLFQE